MTFVPAPSASDSPALFPAQGTTNFTVLQTIITADHQFNNTPVANDNSGYHNIVHLTAQAPNASIVPVAGRLYAKASGLGRLHVFYMDDTPGTSLNYQITPSMPIRASVNFSAPNPTSLVTSINSQFNVSTVVSTGIPGGYIITFAGGMPDQNYMVQITGQQYATGTGGVQGPIIGSVFPSTTYPNSNVGTASVAVYFTNINGISISPLMGNVTIFSVT